MKYINITTPHEFDSIICGRLIAHNFVHMERNIQIHVLIIVEEGILNIEINSIKYKVCKGEAIILPANLVHKGFTDNDTAKELRYFWAHFSAGEYSLTQSPTEEFNLPLHFKLTDYARVNILCNQILDINKLSGVRKKYCDFLFTSLCYELASQTEYENISGNKTVNRAVALIELNIKEKISLETISAQLGYNKRYLAKIFKENMHTTVNKFITKKKLTFAKQMLGASSESIMSVAADLGYDDSLYFMRTFKKHEGITCGEYRRAYSKMYLNGK